MGMMSWPETGEEKKDARLLITPFWESRQEGEGEAAKEIILLAHPALREMMHFKDVVYKEAKHISTHKWKPIGRE